MNKINGNFVCPFCNSTFNLNYSTLSSKTFNFDTLENHPHRVNSNYPETITLDMLKCPSCKQVTVETFGQGSQYEGVKTNIYPKSKAKQFPDYIPKQIRNDYE